MDTIKKNKQLNSFTLYNNIFIKTLFLFCGVFFINSCVVVDIKLPKGPKGEKGENGQSAYEVWKEALSDGKIKWDKKANQITDFFKFLSGEKGKNGKNGDDAYQLWKKYVIKGEITNLHNPLEKWPTDKYAISDFWLFLTGSKGESGQTPHIGDNGNWFIGKLDTKIKARANNGKRGKNAIAPTVTIGANGNWYINNQDSGKKAIGKDSESPTITIGINGNWYINNRDTGKPALGKDGENAEVGLSGNGTWIINGIDTKIPAFGLNGEKGEKGEKGKNGKSAYELWKEYISYSTIPDPHYRNGIRVWPPNKNTIADFWYFLTGEKGKNGTDGIDGTDADK